MNILCLFGVHEKIFVAEHYPSIEAKVVTEYIYKTNCIRCGKTLYKIHRKWNEDISDYEDVG